MRFDKTILMCTSSNNSFYVYPLISISILELELDGKKRKEKQSTASLDGCAHAWRMRPCFSRSSPSRFQSRTDPRTTRRPRTWQMFGVIRSRMRFYREVSTTPNFAVSFISNLSSIISVQFSRIRVKRWKSCVTSYEINVIYTTASKICSLFTQFSF